jgi:zinc protease
MRVPIDTFRLPNGLFVTLSEDHTAPIATVNVWYHVGSANEREGRTGFAHLFEHMLFQGSEDVGSNEHFDIVQRAGGTLNGSTWLERTNYFQTVPSNHLEMMLWLEANRMGKLLPAMTQQKLDTQRDVVKNERRWSMDNQPYGTWWERLPALCFPKTHPFHHSLIGSMADLDAASLDDVKNFFQTYYTPANAVLTVDGDFDPEQARRWIDQHFGPIPRGKAPPPTPDMTMPRVFGEWKRLCLAFLSPVFGSDGYYAASVAAAVLGTRKGSRLHKSLVRERQIAASVEAFTYNLTKGSDLLVIDATGRPGVDAEQLEHEVARELDAIVAAGVTADDVARAVTLIQTAQIAELESSSDRADKLSLFATYFADPSLINDQVHRYATMTQTRVNDFVRERLGADNRASLLFVPASQNGKPSSSVAA